MKTRIEELNNLHRQLKLSGLPDNVLLNVSEDLLNFLLSILRNERPITPDKSLQEWVNLLSILRFHSIMPLLYWKISALPLECHPPKEIFETLRISFLSSRVNFLRTKYQLKNVLGVLNSKGVRTLVLKGAAIGKLVYPDLALRPFADIDLLVHPDQALSARKILLEQGYDCPEKRIEISKDFYDEEKFIHSDRTNPLTVELHWRFLYLSQTSRDVDLNDVFRRAIKIGDFETLHPVDALLQQALHMTYTHSKELRLIWIQDIALLARQLKVPEDWNALQERSVAWGTRLAVEKCLKIAQFWCGLELPAGFDDFSRWVAPEKKEIQSWSETLEKERNFVRFKRWMFFPSGFSEKLRILWRVIFPDPKNIRINFPPPHPWLLPLSYIRRWVKWFKI